MTKTQPQSRVDQGQRRALAQQARSKETRRALVHSAVALWRVKGVDDTTVAEICRAAGVSKGLFYFYFERKEDVLLELGVLSTEAVTRRIRERMAAGAYELLDVIHESLVTMERAMRPNPPDLVARAVLEGYRRQDEIEAGAAGGGPLASILADLFHRAVADRQLPNGVDVDRLAHMSRVMILEGARRWPGWTGGGSFADEVTGQIRLLLNGAAVLAAGQGPLS